MSKEYASVAEIFQGYWKAYGGWSKLIHSPYLHAALLLLAPTLQLWSGLWCVSPSTCSVWWDQSIAVLPNLLGFSLGGFAIFIGFGDEKFRALLAEPYEGHSVNDYVALCATFVHFILVQAMALLSAIVAKGLWFYAPFLDPVREWLPLFNAIGGAIGYGLFLYALTSVMAATMHVFRIARLYADFSHSNNEP